MSVRQIVCLCLVLCASVVRAARADDRSDALLDRARDILSKAHSLTMDRTVSISLEGRSAGSRTEHIRLLKPGFWSMTRAREDPRSRFFDGRYAYSSWDRNKQYIKVDRLKPEILFQDFGPAVGAFLGTGVILPNQSGKYLGKQEMDGRDYEAIDVQGETPGGIPAQQKLFFGPSGLPEIREYRSEIEKGKPLVMQERLTRIQLNAAVRPEEFRLKLPAGYTVLDATAREHP